MNGTLSEPGASFAAPRLRTSTKRSSTTATPKVYDHPKPSGVARTG
jgi:hypothetical protein